MSNESKTQGESALKVASHDSPTGSDAAAIHISTPASAPLPSASDILHPQSQMCQESAVPSSGQVAALARERIMEAQHASAEKPVVDTGAGENSRSFEQRHSKPSRALNRSSNPQSDSESHMSDAGSSETVRANGGENLDQCALAILISSDSPSADSVQKRRETVHLVREVDSEGERAFIRRIVEYH